MSIPNGGEPATGLGLAIARRMIDHRGGSFRQEKRLARGSTFTFTFTLPIAEPRSR